MIHRPPVNRMPTVAIILAAALFLWISIIVTLAQLQMAPTFDEQNHVTRGIAILRTGDFRLCLHHPPLANILEGLPVAWRADTGFSTAMPSWTNLNIWDASRRTIWEGTVNGVRLIQLARIPVLVFTLALALVIFLWSAELFGPWGGLLSLTLFALDPNMLAHSGLATTDIAAACTIVWSIYLLRRYVLAPSRLRLLLAGLGLGLALTAKFSGLILIPITGLLLLLSAFWPAKDASGLLAEWSLHPRWRRMGRATGLCMLLGLTGGLVLWGVYGFHVEALDSKPGRPVAAGASMKAHLPVPALQYLRGLKTVKTEAEGHQAYLLGQTDTTGKGWWYYFPIAVATKTPLPELLAIVGILLLLVLPASRRWFALSRHDLQFLLVPVAVYTLAALGLLGISLNLGIRHVLPLYPFLLILAGGWAVILTRRPLVRGLLAVGLCAQAVSVLLAYPDFLSYFNEAAGGPARGYRILIDSNYDWGQDLGRLADAQQRDHLYPLVFSYFGTTPPEAYGLRYTPAAGFGFMHKSPMPHLDTYHGYFAVSVTNVMGGPGYAGVDYRPLLSHTPRRIGRTIFLYTLK